MSSIGATEGKGHLYGHLFSYSDKDTKEENFKPAVWGQQPTWLSLLQKHIHISLSYMQVAKKEKFIITEKLKIQQN